MVRPRQAGCWTRVLSSSLAQGVGMKGKAGAMLMLSFTLFVRVPVPRVVK